jgi:hypothetical protein
MKLQKLRGQEQKKNPYLRGECVFQALVVAIAIEAYVYIAYFRL